MLNVGMAFCARGGLLLAHSYRGNPYRSLSLNRYLYCEHEPANRVDPSGCDWLDAATNFFAGMGDAITFWLTNRIRDWLDINDPVNHDSGWYKWGLLAGYTWWGAFNGAGYIKGREFAFGKHIRIAPWGNRKGHPYGASPITTCDQAQIRLWDRDKATCPWETKPDHDQSFWSRF